MKKNAEELIRDQKEAGKAFLEMSIAAREADQELSYKLFRLSEACKQAAEELEGLIPKPAEVEGGGSSWWYVCPECHGAVDRDDRHCKHCGQRMN